jgi:hypothetical protein
MADAAIHSRVMHVFLRLQHAGVVWRALQVEDKGMLPADQAEWSAYIINRARAKTLAGPKQDAYHMCHRWSGGGSREWGT